MIEISSVQAIDVHGHYGICRNNADQPLRDQFFSADADTVVQRARGVNVAWTIVSPLSALQPRGMAGTVAGNKEAADMVSRTDGMLQWVVIHPLQEETYRQAEQMLQQPRCIGIKIHPEGHMYHIKDHGRAIFEFAAKHRAVVMTHSGQQNSLPLDFVPFANDFPQVTIILAHLGNSDDRDPSHQVRAIAAGKHDNLYVDTSSAASIMSNLVEWAVAQVGADKILFGTDTPLYSTAMQRIRIESTDLSCADKRAILRDNAVRVIRMAKVVEPSKAAKAIKYSMKR